MILLTNAKDHKPDRYTIMIHVELLGIPGTGKTTIRNNLVAELQHAVSRDGYLTSEEAFLLVGKKKIDIFYRIFLNILPKNVALKLTEKILNRSLLQFFSQNRFIADYPQTLKTYFYSQAYLDLSSDDRFGIVNSFFENASVYKVLEDNFDKISMVFFDEGFLQKISLFSSIKKNDSTNFADCLRYLQSIPLPNILIFLKHDISSCYNRMLERSKGLPDRLKRKRKSLIYENLVTSEAFFQKVFKWLSENTKIMIITVEDNLSLSDTTAQLQIKIVKAQDML